ncbi:hypothetical protein [Brevundimonas subvibrioides]|uniref:Uncharacterized protein n=1 Tax=Brevundimonas subvibrioides (strain ATCC 15264 / DSM 4735 / LMG 14903 / NBRC 16000 / CB 81) TaxID=633149 RepID=D9QI74_BRESC|nr:hypothetical protein [Brevundimonas subvibrioides]ADK99376.1 hypothetical protein Bresu_0062 [Brevundimonas subvibrioides ATCC 15264]
MNAHVVMVLYAGMAFLASGAALLEIARLLGKAFETKVSAPWWVRGLVFLASVILFGYGGVILFPGHALQVHSMSIGLPLVGTVMLAMALWILDQVTGERDPPPWSVDFLRLAAMIGRDSVIKAAAFRTEPAVYLDPIPTDVPTPGRLARVVVILGAAAVIGSVAALILTDSFAG